MHYLTLAVLLTTIIAIEFWVAALILLLLLGYVVLQGGIRLTIVTGLLVGLCLSVVIFYEGAKVSPALFVVSVLGVSIYVAVILGMSNWLHKCQSPIFALSCTVFLSASIEIILANFGWPFSLSVLWAHTPYINTLLSVVGSEWFFALLWGCALLLVQHVVRPQYKLALLPMALLLVVMADNTSGKHLIRIGIMQSDLSQQVTSFPGLPGNMERWKTQLENLAADLQDHELDVIILPESVMPGKMIPLVPVAHELMIKLPVAPVLSHHYVSDESGSLVSSAILWEANRRSFHINSKKRLLPLIEQRLSPGTTSKSFSVSGIKLMALICSESLNPKEVRHSLSNIDVAVVLLNERVLMQGLLPDYHLRLEKLRAIEMGVSIIRASNGGLSGYIGVNGEAELLGKWISGIVKVNVSAGNTTLFSKYYIILHIATLIVTFLLLLTMLPLSHNKIITHEKPNVKVSPYILFAAVIISMAGIFYYSETQTDNNADTRLYEKVSAEDFVVRQLGLAQHYSVEGVDKYLKTIELSKVEMLKNHSDTFGIIDTVIGTIAIVDVFSDSVMIYREGSLAFISIDLLEEMRIGSLFYVKNKPSIETL